MGAKEYGAGEFEVEVAGSYMSKSSNGHDQIQIDFWHPEHGYISAYRYFSEGAMPITLKELNALGWDEVAQNFDIETLHQIDSGDGDVVKPSAIRGAKCRIVTDFEEYDGKSRVKVKFINGLRPQRKELGEAERAAQRQDLRKRLILASKSAGKSVTPPKAPAAKPAPAPAAAPSATPERAQRVEQAVADHADGRGTPPPRSDREPAPAAVEPAPDDDVSFDDIPF